MKTVIEMAKEVCDPDTAWVKPFWMLSQEELERLVDIVRADQDEKYKWDVHSCGPTCTNAVCVAVREAVEAEREACAKEGWMAASSDCEDRVAAAIRARGNI